MRTYANKKSLTNAKDLRQSQTDAEKLLWSVIRNNQLGQKFRRQHPVGPYIADFCCVEKLLIVELDGGQHNEQVDRVRTEFLVMQGYQVLRFWNNDMLQNKEGVLQEIYKQLHGDGPHPDPLPAGEGAL